MPKREQLSREAKPRPMRAVGYVRVSTEGQADNGYGLEAQRKAIREYAKANGRRLVALHSDEGVSGTLKDRPALIAALTDLEAGKAEALLVYRLDRLARDLVLQETILQRLSARGVRVLSVSEPDIDGHDPTRVLVRQVLGAISQYEKAVLMARMDAGKQVKAAQGGYIGGGPRYGTRAVGGELEPVEDEQEAIKLARKLRAKGKSYREICAALEEAGFRPKRARQWYPMVVRDILKRPNGGKSLS